jgi:hypothetical protein
VGAARVQSTTSGGRHKLTRDGRCSFTRWEHAPSTHKLTRDGMRPFHRGLLARPPFDATCMYMHVCMCACVCARARACVRACVCVCVTCSHRRRSLRCIPIIRELVTSFSRSIISIFASAAAGPPATSSNPRIVVCRVRVSVCRLPFVVCRLRATSWGLRVRSAEGGMCRESARHRASLPPPLRISRFGVSRLRGSGFGVRGSGSGFGFGFGF